jgi:hypothetical protein
VREAIDAGASAREIARCAGCGRSVVARALRRPHALSLMSAQRLQHACETLARARTDSAGA